MHFILLGLALVTAALASGKSAVGRRDDMHSHVTNRVKQVGRGRATMNPLVAHLAMYHKYGLPPPPALAAAVANLSNNKTREDDSIDTLAVSDVPQVRNLDFHVGNAPVDYDYQWVCNVTVGKQRLLLDFDTGSSDFWVFSTALPASQRGNHRLYGLGGQEQPYEGWSIAYLDGSSASGLVYKDKIVVGGATVVSQAIEAATSVSSSFTSGTPDGILGLGFPELNACRPTICTSFMNNIRNTLTQPLFTATLRHLAPGEYDFGYIDHSKYTGVLSYVAVNHSQGLWYFEQTGYQIGGKGPIYETSMRATADTGTAYVYVTNTTLARYYAAVKGARFYSPYVLWIFPCTSTLPTFALRLGGLLRVMPAAYVNAGLLAAGSKYCVGTLQSADGLPNAILGDAFLKAFFVVFELAGTSKANAKTVVPRIGFAPQAGVRA